MGLCSRSAAGTGYARQGDMETTPDLTVAERIRTSFGELTRAERQLANVIIENYPVSGLGSITAIAQTSGVSTATVARMTRLKRTGSSETRLRSAWTRSSWGRLGTT